jgi:translation initiation factor IF-2
VEISAKQNIGIDNLLEMILLEAEMQNLKANPQGKTLGTIVESKITQGKGPTATVIVQNGTLKVGNFIAAGAASGRVKSLEDEKGKKLKEVLPSQPAQISGFSELPQAGDILQTVETLEEARQIASSVQRKNRSHKISSHQALRGDVESKTLNLILKTDVAGSLEAIKQSISKLKNEEVKINILSEDANEVNESDVLSAANSKASVIAFRTKVNSKALALAKQKNVVIDSYDVIYELIEDVTSAVIKMFTPELEKHVFGKAKVLAIFRTEKNEMIIGGKVEQGEIKKSGLISIWRPSSTSDFAKASSDKKATEGKEDQNLGRGEIVELQQSKVAAKTVSQGDEFGIKIKTPVKIKEGDILESFEEQIKTKTL